MDKLIGPIASSRHRNAILLLAILAFGLALRLVFFTGIGASDSLAYAEFSNDFGEKEKIEENLFIASRIGLFFPVNILYRLFGVNDFSSNILMLALSLASIVLAYKFGRLLFNEKTGLLAAFLLSFFPIDVVFATRLMTDFPAAFFVGLSVYYFLKSERQMNKVYLLLSGAFLGIAYLIRELTILMGLFFLVYALYHKKFRKEYFFGAAGFFLVFSLELLYFFSMTGNPFFRYTSISTEISVVSETDNYGRGNLPFSLAHYPYIIFTDDLLGLFYPFIFIVVFYFIYYRKKESYNLLFWFIPVLLYISFGTESFTSYVPIPVAARFLAIITLPGILLLAYFLMQENDVIRKVLLPGIVILLLLTSLGYVYASTHRNAIDSEKYAYSFIKDFDKDIYTDSRTIRVFNYLSGFEDNPNIKPFNNYVFLDPENTHAMNLSGVHDSYVVVNRGMLDFLTSSKKGIVFPDEVQDIPENWVLEGKFPSKLNRIEVYYVP